MASLFRTEPAFNLFEENTSVYTGKYIQLTHLKMLIKIDLNAQGTNSFITWENYNKSCERFTCSFMRSVARVVPG